MIRFAYRSRAVALLVAALALLPLDRPAFADPIEEAKAHYKSGEAYYNKGQFEEAVREFKAAYDVAKLPDILFNLARAETKLGHEELAIGYLKQYLEAMPTAPDAVATRAEIEARERALTERIARAKAEAEAEAARRQAAAAAAAAQQAAIDAQIAREAKHPLWPGLGAAVVGAAVLAGGIGAGVVAMNDANKVHAGGGAFTADLQGADSQGRAASTVGVVLDVVGGVVLAAGVGLTIWAVRGRQAPAVQALLAPTPGGIVAAGRF